MMHSGGESGSGVRRAWVVVVALISTLAVGAAGYWATQALRRDDCTTETSRMPDGSQIEITTCS